MKPNTTTTEREQEIIKELSYLYGTRAQIDQDIAYTKKVSPESIFIRNRELTRYAINGRITSLNAELTKINPEKWS